MKFLFFKSGAHHFLLSFYGTNNSFGFEDVSKRNLHIKKELQKFNIKVISFSSDGDSRFIKSQKVAVKYGILKEFCSYKIAGSWSEEICGNQDYLHILNKMRNTLYDTACDLTLGKFSPLLGHLLIVAKKFPKSSHHLVASDLDPQDKMNYRAIEKILDVKVVESLKNIPATEGTRAFLNVMRCFKAAYIDVDTNALERIFNAFYTVHFLRIWKQWIIDTGRSMSKCFISSNAYEGIELNLILLV